MTEKIKIITLCDLLFIFILGVSGSVENALISNTVYYFAFLIPIALALGYIIQNNNSIDLKSVLSDFKITKEGAMLSLPIIIPEIFIVLIISVGTNALMNLLGQTNTATFNETFGYAVVIHALIPAVLEELLFRFIPVKILAGKEKSAVILSSLMFAFAHVNLFQIPHAFVAGLIFASVYIVTGSIIPTIVMHFLNNTVSLMTIYGIGRSWLMPICISLLIISALIIILRRKVYIKSFKSIIQSKYIAIGYPPLLFAILSLILSISVFFV